LGLTTNLIAIAIIAVVGLVFFEEISSGFSSFFETVSVDETQKALDIKPISARPTCDLAITFFGEIEHELFSLPTILRFEFGENTNRPQIAEWQFINCQGSQTQIASFLPRLATNIQIFQQESAEFQITTDQLAELNLSPTDIAQLDLINLFETDYQMQLTVRPVGSGSTFRSCGALFPDLCRTVTLPSGVVPEPFAFEKTFLIKNLPLQEYDIVIVIEGQRINDLEANQGFVYNVRFL